MQQSCPYGSVRGGGVNSRPYRDCGRGRRVTAAPMPIKRGYRKLGMATLPVSGHTGTFNGAIGWAQSFVTVRRCSRVETSYYCFATSTRRTTP
jgi:hypothetical protein